MTKVLSCFCESKFQDQEYDFDALDVEGLYRCWLYGLGDRRTSRQCPDLGWYDRRDY